MFKYSFLVFAFTGLFIYGSAQNIRAANTSHPSAKKGYFDWTVFIQSDNTTLNSIDHVEYLLHPSFPNPQVTSYDKANNFSYSASGWGEFEIKIKVVFKDPNRTPLYITHWLALKA